MTYTVEKSLRDFDFWAGAKDTVAHLTLEDLDRIEEYLENVDWTSEMPTQTEINDLFWFNPDYIACILGYEDWEELLADREKED